VEELLCHESGLPAWLPLFEQVPRTVRGQGTGASHLLELTLSTPISSAQRGTALYSDLGYLLLGAGLEALSGESLDALVRNRIAAPLGLPTLSYRPWSASRNDSSTIVATEDCPWRGRLLVGQVHDDNAWAGGGVCGQAGLFGTAKDVARFGVAWMQWLKRDGLLSSDWARRAVARRSSGRALAWDCRSDVGSSAGSLLGPRTFGHLGFTGCSLWIDPDLDVSIALLTNRVRMGRGNDALKAFRPAFYDAVVSNANSA
jgi:CubicO group peptidase (beta-lactamase class C family)